MTPTLRQASTWGLPLALYTAIGVAQTWRAFTSPVPVILGGGDQPDWTGTLWTWWWTWTALVRGQSPSLATDNLFPIGLDPVAQYNLLDGILLGWLIPLVGPTRGYNLAGLLVLMLAGVAGWQLCRRLHIPQWAAVFGGVLLQTSTTVLVETTTGRLSQALLLFAVLAFSGLLTLSHATASRRAAVAAGIWTALTALTYWYAAVFVALAALPAVLTRWRRLPWVMAAAGVCGLVCLPALLSLMGHGSDLAGLQRVPEAWMAGPEFTRGSHGLGMALGHAHQPLWPIWTAPGDGFDKRMSPILLILAAIGAVRSTSPFKKPLIGAVLVGWLLTLGPWLRGFDGTPLPIPLPWLLLHAAVPYFERLWWPERFELTMLLGMVPLAAMGLGTLATRWHTQGVAAVVGMALLVETGAWQRFHPLPASPPRAFDATLYAAIDGPMVTLPVRAPFADIRHVLWLQVLHGQPITGGLGEHLPGHVPTAWVEYSEQNDLLDALYDATQGPLEARDLPPAAIDALQRSGLKWVVSDAAVLPRGDARDWQRRDALLLTAIWGAPDVQTPTGAAWRIEPIPNPVRLPALDAPPKLPNARAFSLGRPP